MSTIDVPLGRAGLHSAESGLSVELTSSAHFAASEEGDVDQLRQRLTTACMTDQGIDKPWTRPGVGFRLIFSLRMAAVLASHDQDEMVQVLSEQIQRAKVGIDIAQAPTLKTDNATQMWKELNLTPTSTHSSFESTTGSHNVTTYLAFEDCTTSQRRRLHKLDVNVPIHDVRPPQGVTQATCEVVRLCLSLSQHYSRKRRRCVDPKGPGACEQSPQPEILMESDAKNRFDDGLFLRYEDSVPEDYDDLWLTEQGPELVDDGLFTARSGSGPPFSISHPQEGSTQPSEKRTAGDVLHTSICVPIAQDDCVRAVEAAVRLAICGMSHLSKGSYSVTSGGDISALSDIMPSIWSPNYLDAVASRAVFMPTICHALESVLVAPTGALRRESTEASSVQAVSDAHRADVPDGSRMSAQLWRHVQSVMHQDTRELTRLSVPDEERRGSADDLEDPDANASWANILVDSPQVIDEYVLADDYSDDDLLDETLDFCDADDWECAAGVGEGQPRHDLNEHLPSDYTDGTQWVCASNSASDIRTHTSAEHLDRTEAKATSTWRGGESKLVSPSSQFTTMPSQAHVRHDDLILCKSKRPALNFELRDSPMLQEQEGRDASMESQREFKRGGNEIVVTEVDVRFWPSEECDMLCL